MERHELLEEDLKDYSYQTAESNKNGSHIAENHTTPYPMVSTYYEIGEGQYPDEQDGYFLPAEQQEFVKEMCQKCQKYAEGIHNDRFSERNNPGWKERFKRSWASFTRDVHFRFLVSSNFVFDTVEYSIKRDRKDNIDLIGHLSNKEYHMHLFIDSSKGRQNLERKISNKSSNAVDILVPLNPNGYKKVIETESDNLWLYTREHVESVREIVNGEDEKIIEHLHQNTKIERL